MLRYKITTIILMILLLAFSIYFYFYTESLNNLPVDYTILEGIENSKKINKQLMIKNKQDNENITINTDVIINDNIKKLKNSFKNENLIVSPINYYLNLFIVNEVLNQKHIESDLLIFGNTEHQINKSINVIYDKLINSDKDNVDIYNKILVNKNKLFNNEKTELLKEKFNLDLEQLSFNNEKTINSTINKFYLDITNDLLKNFVNENFKYDKILSTNTMLFNNNWSSEYNKTNKLNDKFYGIEKTNNVTFLQSPINKYYENKNLISIEKEYNSGTYSFRAITTTNENKTINELLEIISIEEIRDLFSKEITFENHKTIGIIPEFKIESYSEYRIFKRERNYQKIYFSLDRYGSLTNKTKNKEQEIIKPETNDNNHIILLNRPFIFFVWNNELNIPILSGIVCNLK